MDSAPQYLPSTAKKLLTEHECCGRVAPLARAPHYGCYAECVETQCVEALPTYPLTTPTLVVCKKPTQSHRLTSTSALLGSKPLLALLSLVVLVSQDPGAPLRDPSEARNLIDGLGLGLELAKCAIIL